VDANTMEEFSFDVDKIYNFYHRYIKGHGIRAGWATLEDQINSYKEASSCSAQIWNNFGNVLDVGSGQGHFMQFLRQERDFTGRYTGIELLDVLHKEAVEFYGKFSDTHFIYGDFLSHNFGSDRFDWVVSLGSLAVKQIPQNECDLAFCRKMINLAQYGVSIFLNDINYMRPGRLEEVPELATHNVDEFIFMIQENFTTSKIEVKHYPDAQSQPTMIHIIL